MGCTHLRHKEVADLLYATPLGLTDWDIKLLLSTATEFETGRPGYEMWRLIFTWQDVDDVWYDGWQHGWDAHMTWVLKLFVRGGGTFGLTRLKVAHNYQRNWPTRTFFKVDLGGAGAAHRKLWREIWYTSMARIEYKPFVAAAPEIIEGGRVGGWLSDDLRTSWKISLVFGTPLFMGPSPISYQGAMRWAN